MNVEYVGEIPEKHQNEISDTYKLISELSQNQYYGKVVVIFDKGKPIRIVKEESILL